MYGETGGNNMKLNIVCIPGDGIGPEIVTEAKKVLKKTGHVKPGIKGKFIFSMMKMMQKNMGYSPADAGWWKEQGWI